MFFARTEAPAGTRRAERRFPKLKRVLPRTLFARSLLIIVMPLVLVQLVATWIFYDRHWETISKRLTYAVAGEIALVIESMRLVPDRAAVLRSTFWTMELRMRIIDDARLPATAPPFGGSILDRQLERALVERVRRPFQVDSRSRPREVAIWVQLPEGVLEVIAPRERLFSSTIYLFLFWMVGTSLIVFIVAGLFMRAQIRPIRRLAAAVDAFGKGRDPGEFRVVGASEVRLAARAFRLMRNRIMRQIQQRTEMLAGVSHDLRTPLTRMKLELALLGERPGVADLKADIDEMERMLEGYLAFARGEGSETALPTRLAELLDEVAAGARREGGEITVSADPGLVVPLKASSFKRCLTNLVGNGLRYGRHVDIAALRRGNTIQLTIDDDGPGIPAGERENVFRPFYRLEGSRNPETGGVGLGLSIARDVVHGHGGNIRLDASPSGGLRVVISIPS